MSVRHRIDRLLIHLGSDAQGAGQLALLNVSANDASEQIRIGDVSRVVSTPRRPELVPGAPDYLDVTSQEILEHIQFLMKKDNLGQVLYLFCRPPRSHILTDITPSGRVTSWSAW